MNLILIDRNIVSDIRQYNNGKRDHDFSLAKSADKAGNFVSPLMSIIEGRLRNPQSYTNMYDTLNNETTEIEKFYKHARTDSNFLKLNSLEMISAFSKKSEEDVAKYAPLIKFLQKKLANPIAEERSSFVQKEILDYVIDNFYYPGHPVTICGLSCLHGNSAAQKVLKPKVYSATEEDGAAYNALLDILLANQLAYIRNLQGKDHKTAFLTRDQALKNFLSQIKIVVKKQGINRIADEEITAYDATFNIELFPNLKKSPKKYKDLLDAIETAQRKTVISNPRRNSIAKAISALRT